jgi:hypothetical protein
MECLNTNRVSSISSLFKSLFPAAVGKITEYTEGGFFGNHKIQITEFIISPNTTLVVSLSSYPFISLAKQ